MTEKQKYAVCPEREDWDKYGCSNRMEWREHLNKEIWSGYTPKLSDDETL